MSHYSDEYEAENERIRKYNVKVLEEAANTVYSLKLSLKNRLHDRFIWNLEDLQNAIKIKLTELN